MVAIFRGRIVNPLNRLLQTIRNDILYHVEAFLE